MTTLNIHFADDDSFVIQDNTIYAYVQYGVTDSASKEILSVLKNHIEKNHSHHDFTIKLEYYDSAKFYPHLVGTENDSLLYKRWQLKFTQITPRTLDTLVQELEKQDLHYQGLSLKFDISIIYNI